MGDGATSATMYGGAAGVVGAGVVNIGVLSIGAPAPAPEPSGPVPRCPYPGLAYFGPSDSALFFGREAAVAALERAVENRSFTALVGASGSGKSSVVLAGLAPRLDAKGGWLSSYFRISMEPDKNPFLALARAFASLLVGPSEDVIDEMARARKLGESLQSGDLRPSDVIAQCRKAHPAKRILLIADQFEEIFTLATDETFRNRFIGALIDSFAAGPSGGTSNASLVLTMRADFYNTALLQPSMAKAFQDRVENLPPMTREELRTAVIEPAKPVGFEPGLVEAILDDVERRPGSLPLLQFALREMWGRLEKPMMTRAVYDAIDGVEGALAKRAHSIFLAATDEGKNAEAVAAFRRLFTRMVTLGEGAEDTRRIVQRAELGADAWALAQKLAGEDNRLVVIAAPNGGQETTEVVHEALIRNWPELIDWVNRDRAFLAWRNRLKPRLDQMRQDPWDEDLLRGGALAIAEDWLARRGDELNSDERAFIRESLSARDRAASKAAADFKREQERVARTGRAQRLARWALAALGLVVLVGLGVALWQGAELRAQKSAIALMQDGLDVQRLQLDSQQEKLAEAERTLARSNARLAEQQTAASELQKSLDAEQIELRRQHARLLGELGLAKLYQGEIDSALRLAARGARVELELPAARDSAWSAAAELAAVVCNTPWLRNLVGHTSGLTSAAFNPDHSRLVTASYDNTARIWDGETGKQIAILAGHRSRVTTASFSPDGARVITASDDGTARIWDAATSREVLTFTGHKFGVQSARFSPDGARAVTASLDGTARVWDAATGREIVALHSQRGPMYSAEFDSSGARVLTASADGTARLWDAATGAELLEMGGHDGEMSSAAFSPDGSRVVTTSGAAARIWSAATGKQVAVLLGHSGPIYTTRFSPDGAHVVTGSDDRTARVWDAATGNETARLMGHGGPVFSAIFSPDGAHVVTGSQDKTVRIWDSHTGEEVRVLHGHLWRVSFVAFSPDNARFVSASWDWTARVYDLNSDEAITVLRGHAGGVTSASFSPDGARVVTGSNDMTARLWDAATGKEIEKLSGHGAGVSSAGFSPDGARIVTASDDGTARVWDAASGREIAKLGGHRGRVSSASFSPNGARVTTGSDDKTARVWDAATGDEIAVLSGHQGRVSSVAFSPDGTRVVTSSDDKTARVWDAVTGKLIVILRGHEAGVASAVFSPDGAHVITASRDNTTRLWSASSGEEITRFGRAPYNAAAFSPDGSRVVNSLDDYTNAAQIWDTATGVQIMALQGHRSPVRSSAFSPDGTRVVTASDDRTARIWDVRRATLPTSALLEDLCSRLIPGRLGAFTRDEMRLAGYPDSQAPIDVCE
jgi:WD40 repeat protein